MNKVWRKEYPSNKLAEGDRKNFVPLKIRRPTILETSPTYSLGPKAKSPASPKPGTI